MTARDLFLSHSSGDAATARELRSMLEGAGYSVWMAPDDVLGTDPWAAQILTAIETSRAMVILVSQRSIASSHVAREVELARSKGRAVLPVRIENVAPTGALEYHLAGLQRLDMFPPPIAGHREGLLRRVAPIVVPTGIADGPAAPPAAIPTPPPTIVTPPRAGIGAWARANSMLAGAAVTLAALFVVGAAAMALSGPGPAATGPRASGAAASGAQASQAAIGSPTAPTTSALATIGPAATGPDPSRSRPAVAAGGAFPNAAEVDLYLALPFFAARDIADCTRTSGELAGAVARIDCYAATGEHVFYSEWPDVPTLQADFRTYLRVNMDNPVGSCATAPVGDTAWSRNEQVAGRLACQLWDGGPSVTFAWTDEARRVSAVWYGSGSTVPEDDRALGYALFLAWTAG